MSDNWQMCASPLTLDDRVGLMDTVVMACNKQLAMVIERLDRIEQMLARAADLEVTTCDHESHLHCTVSEHGRKA